MARVLAFTQLSPDTTSDILTLPIEGNEKSGWKVGEPRPFLNGPFNERDPAFSPDGRWLAYSSDESGNSEVYVRPFSGPGGKWQISTGGGLLPRWSRSSKEFFYRTTDSKIMVATYTASGDSFHADKPQLWSPGQFTSRGGASNFDVHRDGKRFVVLKDSAVLKDSVAGEAKAVNKVNFILNFFDEIRHKVTPGKN